MANELARRDNSTPFQIMDRLDDDLIKQELEGKIPETLTYHYKQGGQEVWGLSKAGVDECARELAKQGEVIRELELTFTQDEDSYYFTGKVGRYAIDKDGAEVLLDTKYGMKQQAKKRPFSYEMGGMKAMRNATRRCIPKAVEQGIIEYAKSKGKVKEVIPAEPINFPPEEVHTSVDPTQDIVPPPKSPRQEETERINRENAEKKMLTKKAYTLLQKIYPDKDKDGLRKPLQDRTGQRSFKFLSKKDLVDLVKLLEGELELLKEGADA